MIGFSYRLGCSTVSRIVNEVCDALWKNMQPVFLPELNVNTWVNIEKDLSSRCHFLKSIDAIDGKHILIRAPLHSGLQFFKYRKLFSVVFLPLIDTNCKFIIIDTGCYSKNSDGNIFSNSVMAKQLMDKSLDIPPDKA